MNLNHPVKSLYWIKEPSYDPAYEVAGVKFDKPATLTDKIKLVLNGHDRIAAREGHYFEVQPYQHHSGLDKVSTHITAANTTGTLKDLVMMYSFALEPEEHQPSGTCNFSKNR